MRHFRNILGAFPFCAVGGKKNKTLHDAVKIIRKAPLNWKWE